MRRDSTQRVAEETATRQHNARMAAARREWGRPVCPDCYQPASRCEHVFQWAFLRRARD